MSDAPDIKGLWQGHYQYSASAEIGKTPFKARFGVSDGTLTGLIIEDHNISGKPIKAEIAGSFDGHTLRFTKRYAEAGTEYGRPVKYVGELSADGTSVSGTWTLPDDSGTFSMARPE